MNLSFIFMDMDALVVFPVAWLFAIGLTPLLARLAGRAGWVDRPGERKIHPTPVPFLGGPAVLLAASVALWILPPAGPSWPLLAAVALVAMVGLADDGRRDLLSPLVRLVFEAAAAVVVVLSFPLRIELLPGGPLPNTALSVVFIVGIANAFNLSDNMNGLCAGMVAAVTTVLGIAWSVGGGGGESATALAIGGAATGFLLFNYPRASIFLGDGGSLPLGFLVAVLVLDGTTAPTQPGDGAFAVRFLVPIVATSVVILDTGLVSVSRLRRGVPPWIGDSTHLSHRLVGLGCSRTLAVALLVVASGFNAVVAAWMQSTRSVAPGGAALLVVIVLGLLASRHPGLGGQPGESSVSLRSR